MIKSRLLSDLDPAGAAICQAHIGLINILPCSAIYDFQHGRSPESVFRARLSSGKDSGGNVGSNFANLTRVQLSVAVKSLAALLNHVVAIVLGCSKKQVLGPNARRVITSMENTQADWNIAEMENPRDAVRGHHRPAKPSSANTSVACRVFGSNPDPAFICLPYLAPKANRQRRLLSSVVTVAVAPFRSASRYLSRNGFERIAAGLALDSNCLHPINYKL